MEHEIGGEFDVIHGEGIAAILPSIIRYVARRQPQRYAQLAVRVLGADPYDDNEERLALLLADYFESFFKLFGLATSLNELNIPETAIEHIAERLTDGGSRTVGNYSPLTCDDVVEVLRLAY